MPTKKECREYVKLLISQGCTTRKGLINELVKFGCSLNAAKHQMDNGGCGILLEMHKIGK